MAVQGSSDILIDELYETTHQLRNFVEARLRTAGSPQSGHAALTGWWCPTPRAPR